MRNILALLVVLAPLSAIAQTAYTNCYRMGNTVNCNTTQVQSQPQPPQHLENYIEAMGGTANLAHPFDAIEQGIAAGRAECHARAESQLAAGNYVVARAMLARCG